MTGQLISEAHLQSGKEVAEIKTTKQKIYRNCITNKAKVTEIIVFQIYEEMKKHKEKTKAKQRVLSVTTPRASHQCKIAQIHK